MAGDAEPKAQASDKRHKEQRKWFGREPWIYRHDMWRNASEIKIARVRQILIWPLTLRLPNQGSAKNKGGAPRPTSMVMEHIRQSLAATPWGAPIGDLLDHAPAPRQTLPDDRAGPDFEKAMDEAQRYGEFVYFHDFVQRMIFQPARNAGDVEDGTPFSLHRRKDVARVEFDIRRWGGCGRFAADVERCNLYLFDTGAAVLALEIDFGLAPAVTGLDQDGNPGSPCRMTLADVQTFTDHARRA